MLVKSKLIINFFAYKVFAEKTKTTQNIKGSSFECIETHARAAATLAIHSLFVLVILRARKKKKLSKVNGEICWI